jgi:hypothetical protein
VKKATLVMTMVMALLISMVGMAAGNVDDWTFSDGVTTDGSAVVMDIRNAPGGASIEKVNYGAVGEAGEPVEIKFTFEILDGDARCDQGAPRAFVRGGAGQENIVYASGGNASSTCPDGADPSQAPLTVSGTVPGGDLGDVGLVFDNTVHFGVARFTQFSIGGVELFAGTSGYIYAEQSFDITVLEDFDLAPQYATALELSWSGPTEVKEGETHGYRVRLRNRTELPTKDNVLIVAGLSGHDLIETVEYQDEHGTWHPLTVDETITFGPSGGFPVPAGYNEVTDLRITFQDSGTITGVLQAVGQG